MKNLLLISICLTSIISCAQNNSLDRLTAKEYYLNGCNKERQMDTLGAIQEYSKAIDFNPKDIDGFFKSSSYSNRGLLKFGLRDYRGAIQDFDSAIKTKTSQTSGFNYYYKAWSKTNLGDNDGALQDYNKAIEIEPKMVEAYENRGFLKIKMGQKDDGCLDFGKAGEIGYKHAYELIKQYCQ